jgi:3-phosphoglycerate kinase
MSINYKTIDDYDLSDKTVLIRSDLNVPVNDEGEVEDDFRIKKSIPTIKHVLDEGGTAVLMSHLGRPEGKEVEHLKMDSVAGRLQEHLSHNVTKLDDCVGVEVEESVENAEERSVFLLENLRFHPEEKENLDEFAKQLAFLGDVYVNDAFGTCHRRHASIVGVPNYIQQSGAGKLLEDEIEHLLALLESPDSPFTLLLGGAKVTDKVGMVQSLLPNLDQVLVGGAMSYPFLRAKGHTAGDFELDAETINAADEILDAAESAGVTIDLPVDHLVTDSLDEGSGVLRISEGEIQPGWNGGDIGPESIRTFNEKLSESGTVFWNGPMGIFEQENFSRGSELIARHLAEQNDITRVTGGGDTAAVLSKYDLDESYDHVSTGGGALIQFLQKGSLPGLEALPNA